MSDKLTPDELMAIRARASLWFQGEYRADWKAWMCEGDGTDVPPLLAHIDALQAELDLLHRVIDDLPEGAKAFLTTRWRQEAATNREGV